MGPEKQYDSQWHEHWEEGVAPGSKWDAGLVSPILDHLLSSDLKATGQRVLVPGCGRGYDVFSFASHGAALAVGLDLSPQAIAAAEQQRSTTLASSPTALAAAQLTAGNFFTYSHESNLPFDIGYDYTFLCALHPDMRGDWAAAWARLLGPGGELLTLIFPVGGNPPGAPQNPPWPVTPELYKDLLLPAGFQCEHLEPIPAEFSHKGRAGREWLGRWRRSASGSSSSEGDSSGEAAARL